MAVRKPPLSPPALTTSQVPGRLFWTELDQAQSVAPCPYTRLVFGNLTKGQITEGIKRLGAALRLLQQPAK